MNTRNLEHSGVNEAPEPFFAFIGISMGLHGLLFVLLIVMTGYAGCQNNAFSSDVITVDLAALPASAPAPRQAALREPAVSEAVKAPGFKKPEKIPEPIGAKKERSGPPEMKTALKKKTYHPEKTMEEALKDLARKVEETPEPDPLADAFSRLNKAVEEKQRHIRVSGEAVADGRAGGGPIRRDNEVINLYKLEIRYRILKNWVYPRQITGGDEDLQAVIGIHISKAGKLLDVWFDKRSGNDYYDESARKAVLKSEPLPPLPEGYESYKVGLEFTPSDRR
ncbi:MAG: TonB family protein [Thermodesulfobacteriota bacterium]|nr:TonB family protein [Thermodesulfobacteriota bacterium]